MKKKPPSDKESLAFVAAALEIAKTADKLKRVMLKRGLRAAKAVCPHCEGGYLHGRLNGHKNHLHMRCDKCSAFFME